TPRSAGIRSALHHLTPSTIRRSYARAGAYASCPCGGTQPPGSCSGSHTTAPADACVSATPSSRSIACRDRPRLAFAELDVRDLRLHRPHGLRSVVAAVLTAAVRPA